MPEMAEQPRNTCSEVQRAWAWRLQLKVTCNSCSEASEQYKIGILQRLGDGAGSSPTWWEEEAELWQDTP